VSATRTRARTQARPRPDAVPPPPVHVIHEHAVYSADAFRQVFGLSASSLRREVRERRLRVYKRCGRYYLLGEDVLDWLRGGLVRARPQPVGSDGGNGKRG
jgi:hypothetical protein